MFRTTLAMLLWPMLVLATDGLYAQGNNRREWTPLLSPMHRINPGFSINSRFDETKPMLSSDGKILYFARKHHPDNSGGSVDPQDIYSSSTSDGIHWSPAKNSGRAVNTARADNLCGIISENELIFYVPAGRNHGKFVVRDVRDENASKIIGPEVANESAYLEAAFSYDLQVVLFTAKSRNNVAYDKEQDERDIYYSTRTMDGWTEPRNLGAVINSSADEFSPFLAADGRTLYFASSGRGGFGGADVFVSRRTGNEWDEWSAPENLGPEINSKRFDGYFTLSPASRIAYMVSNSNALGKSDIIAIAVPEKYLPATSTPWNFTVTDIDSNRPAPTRITISDANENSIAEGVTDHQGKVTLFLPRRAGLRISVRSAHFVPFQGTLPDSGPSSFHVALHPVPALDPALSHVLFERGTAAMLPTSRSVLDTVVTILQNSPHKQVELLGHTDDMGTFNALKNLSMKRVDAVRDYLVAHGISPRRVSGKAFAGLKPAIENTNEESRRKNRRVELVLR